MPDVIIYALVSAVVSFAVTELLAPDIEGAEDNGATVNKSGTSASRNPVYGTCITGAVPCWNNVSNNNSEVLVNVFACGIGVTNVRQVIIDDVEVLLAERAYRETSTGGNGQLTFSDSDLKNGFEKQCSIQIRAGLDTGVPLGLAIDNGDGEWTADMRGDRVCAVAIKSKRITDEDGIRIVSDSFKMNLLVDGLALYDPRFHSTGEREFTHSDPSVPTINRECGRNPALALMDYLVDDYYGLSIDFKYIDLASFISAANWCDNNTVKIDGQIDNSSSFSNAIEAICKSGGLTVFVENGFITVKYEDVEMASHDFNEDNIINGTFGIVEQSSSNYANCVEVEFKNTDLNDEQDTYTLPADVITDPTIIADGRIQVETLSMPMTRSSSGGLDSSSIKLFANRTLRKNKFQKQVEFDCDLLEDNVKIFEVITVTDVNLNWNKKEFRVTSIKKSVNAEKMNIATLSCVEYDPSVYTGSADGGGGGSKPSKPVIVSPPTNITFKLHDLITTGSSTLAWSRTWYETESQFDVEIKTASSSSWKTLGRTSSAEWKLPNLYPDTYDFRVRTWSNLYGNSNWTQLLNQVVSQLATFPPVTGLSCDATTRDFYWSWDDMLGQSVVLPIDVDPTSPNNPIVRDYFSHYQIDILNGSTLLASFQAASNEYIFTFEQNTARIRQLTANVYIVALDGSKSQLDIGSVFTETNNQCIAPAGIVDTTALQTTIITWDTVPESDYRATRFYTSTTAGFTPDDTSFLKEQVGNLFTHIWPDELNHYIRFAHVDLFGNDSLVLSPEITVIPTTIDLELPIDPRFDEIRNPEGAEGSEQVFKSADGDYVTGIGIYADAATEDTTVLIAANQLLMGVGGRPYYFHSTPYFVGDKVLYEHTPKITGLYECKSISVGFLPTDTAHWTVLQSNVNKAVFSVEEDGRVLIKNALIENLNGNKITADSITAREIDADTITGNEISSATTITAGSGNNVGVLDGTGTWRIYAGHATPTSAPFRVDQIGNMYASRADITGEINATSGSITGTLTVGRSTSSSNYVRFSGAGAAGSSNEFMRVQDGGYRRVHWGYDGRLIMYAGNSNTSVLDFNPAANTYIFKGTVQADKIDSDVVSATVKSIAAYDSGAVHNFYKTLYSGSIGASASSASRILVLPSIQLDSYGATNSNSTKRTTVGLRFQVKIDSGAWVNATQKTATSSSAGSGVYRTDPNIPFYSVVINGNAHTYQTRFYLYEISYTNTESMSWSAQNILPQIFRQGSSIT